MKIVSIDKTWLGDTKKHSLLSTLNFLKEAIMQRLSIL